jgi:hypothetical protein
MLFMVLLLHHSFHLSVTEKLLELSQYNLNSCDSNVPKPRRLELLEGVNSFCSHNGILLLSNTGIPC